MFVLNSLAGGGAERTMLTLLEASRERLGTTADFRLVLLDHDPRDHRPPDWLPIDQLDSRHSLWRSVRSLHNLCNQWRPDVTVSFLTRANIASITAARLLGHRTIISERADTAAYFHGRGMAGKAAQALVRIAYPRADRAIAVSQGVADRLTQHFDVPANRVDTIANPVSFDRIAAMAGERPTNSIDGPYAVCVSRLTPVKNVALVIEAMAKMPEPLRLFIIGQGPDEDRLRARAAALDISSRVVFTGFQTNPHAITARAAFCVSGSNSEGFPNGLIEALALGVPVLATNCASGPSELLDGRMQQAVSGLTYGRWGIIVPPDDVDAMVAGMKAILTPDNQVRYRNAGPQRASDFDLEETTARYWRLIGRVLAGAGK